MFLCWNPYLALTRKDSKNRRDTQIYVLLRGDGLSEPVYSQKAPPVKEAPLYINANLCGISVDHNLLAADAIACTASAVGGAYSQISLRQCEWFAVKICRQSTGE